MAEPAPDPAPDAEPPPEPPALDGAATAEPEPPEEPESEPLAFTAANATKANRQSLCRERSEVRDIPAIKRDACPRKWGENKLSSPRGTHLDHRSPNLLFRLPRITEISLRRCQPRVSPAPRSTTAPRSGPAVEAGFEWSPRAEWAAAD